MSERATFVYFVRAASGEGPVRIGWSYQPAKAFRSLQGNSPVKLALLAQAPGTVLDHAFLNCLFYRFKRHGSWVFPRKELLVLIDRVVRDGSLPEWATAAYWRLLTIQDVWGRCQASRPASAAKAKACPCPPKKRGAQAGVVAA